jgi:hypothetical protein
MCVVSMVMEHYTEKWDRLIPRDPFFPLRVPLTPPIPAPAITPAEIEEFHVLLARAREYDRKHNQPDCELAEKKAVLQKIAEALGVPIQF